MSPGEMRSMLGVEEIVGAPAEERTRAIVTVDHALGLPAWCIKVRHPAHDSDVTVHLSYGQWERMGRGELALAIEHAVQISELSRVKT